MDEASSTPQWEAEKDTYILPAALPQARFWALDRQKPGNPTWNLPVRYRLEGRLDTALIEQAFQQIVQRHEPLRAHFQQVDGEVMQVIESWRKIEVPVTDLRHLPKPAQDAEVDRISFEEARRSFDLERGPLLRVQLLQTGDEDHLLLVTPHHSVADYWSVGMLSNEMGAIYEAAKLGRTAVLPELKIQYGDYAIWQHEQAASEATRAGIEYWKRQLQDLPLAEFPTDRPREAEQSFDASITSMLLPLELTNRLKDLANREGATFFNLMLAAFGVVVRAYTGQSDFGVGTQVAGRSSVELEPLIGLFINTVVLRPRIEDEKASFVRYLASVNAMGVDALEHQGVRFEQVLKELRPEGYPRHDSLFRVNFICQRDPVKPLEFSGIRLTVVPSKSQGALYELNVFLILRTEGWRLACEFNTALFDTASIVKMLEDYRKVMEAIAADPERPVSELSRVGPASRPEAADGGTAKGIEPVVAPAGPSSRAESPVEVAKEGINASAAYAFPMAAAQERFWQLDQLAPGNAAMNMPMGLRLRGKIDIAALERSLRRLMERHEALRTTFAEVDGAPRQVVHAVMPVQIEQVSLNDLNEADREVRAQQLVQEEAMRPFQLQQGPLVRVTLIHVNNEDRILLVTMPHILCDGWSNGIFIRELAELYRAALAGDEPRLAPLPLQFADYACWQNESLKQVNFDEDLDYWRRTLAGDLPVLDLPADRPFEPGLIARGNVETVVLPAAQLARLKELCRREEATLYMLFLAAWLTLLHRYTGAEDLLAGSPVAGRTPETENIVGLFSYPIAIRVNLSGEPAFRETLRRVREATLGALSHKDLPFERLAAELRPAQVRGRNPLFQIYFLYQVAFLQPMELPGSTWTPLVSVSPGTPFDLSLGLLERPEGVVMRLEYKPGLFEASRMRRALRHLLRVVDVVENDLDVPIGQIPIEPEMQPAIPSEPRQAPEWSEPAEGFWRFAERQPDAPAVVNNNGAVSYGELASMVRGISRQFSELAARGCELVGVALPDLGSTAAAALAAIDAGVPFVNLGRQLDDRDLLRRLKQSGMKFALASGKAGAALQELGVPCFSPAAASAEGGPRASGRDRKAEVRITSGSGRRLVAITAGVLAAQMSDAAAVLELESGRRVALGGGEIRSEELLGALACGCVLTDVKTPSAAASWLEAGAETIVLSSQAWREAVRLARPLPLSKARLVAVRGEAAPGPVLAAWRQLAGSGHRWIALYGTAESGSAAMSAEPESAPGIPGSSPGVFTRTAPHVEAQVLDRVNQPGPVGIRGELSLRGAAVEGASGNAGDWLKTGDKAIRCNAGIEYLGPENAYLNLGGYCVTAAAIEAPIERIAGVRSACAFLLVEERQRPRVAVAVELETPLKASEPSREEALRRHVRSAVEERLGRSTEVVALPVEALPRLADGRPDRVAVASRFAASGGAADRVAPRDAVETRLAEIWSEVFGSEPVGIRDNFFDLGGSSFTAVRLFALIEPYWGKRLPLSTLFHAPTIEQLAEILREEWTPRWSSLVEVQAGGSRPPLYIISGLGGNVVRFRDLARRLGRDQPVFALQPPGLDGKAGYLTTLEEMAAHYLKEIRREQPIGPYHIAGYSFGGLVTFEMASQLAREGEPAGLVALLDAPEWNYNKEARAPRTVMARWQRLQDRVQNLIRGPGRLPYLSQALRWRLTDVLFRLHEFLHLPVPQWCARIEDVNRHAARRYVPRALPGKLTLFRTVRSATDRRTDLLMGWGRFADAVEVHEVPGDHMDMTAEPHVQVLAAKLRQSLDAQIHDAEAGNRADRDAEIRSGEVRQQPPAFHPTTMRSARLTT